MDPNELVILAVEVPAGEQPARGPDPFFEFYRTDFRALRSGGVPVALRRTRDGRWAVAVPRASVNEVARVLGRAPAVAEAGELLAPG